MHLSNGATLNDIIHSNTNKLVVIDFTASWCRPCQMISPLLDEMSVDKSFHDKVIFIKVDVDEFPDIAKSYNVASMPTFLFIKNKQILYKISGANKDLLRLNVNRFAGNV